MIPHGRKKSIRRSERGLEKAIYIFYNMMEIVLFKERQKRKWQVKHLLPRREPFRKTRWV